MAQASFFYYNPESGNDSSRQHDLFTPQPSAILRSSPMPSHEAAMQQYYIPPIATPKPLSYRPALLSQEPQVLSLDTAPSYPEDAGYPMTPGFSVAGSSVSSPPNSNYLPTPTNGFFENLPGVKEGCEREVKSEILAGIDWTRAGSPPLTPVFVHPPSVTASQASELPSISPCPSLSPSPSPAPRSAISDTESFCDPRNLLVASKPSTFLNQLEIPTLPAFISSNDDLLLGVHPAAPSKPMDIPATFDSLTPIFDDLASFDSLSDLDSEKDFLADLSQEQTFYHGAKRQRLSSIPFSTSDEELSEASFDDDFSMSFTSAPSPAETINRDAGEGSSIDFDSNTGFVSTLAGGSTEASKPDVAAGAAEDEDETPAATPSEGTTAQQANRRGRKQSLTDDPSKTFICTLCSRRFRRQEHLKRHYRSLHTHDKPFECTDCGKKFSRSDNLAQHARTHGATTTIIGVDAPATVDEKTTATMSAVLFETAAAAGSSSSSSSSGSEDEKSIKKRKRDD